jgi:hypothetical protein
MSVEGTFQDSPISDILQWIDSGRKTGILFLESGKQEIKIFFSRGKVLWAEDNLRNPEMRLGIILTETCKIDQSQLNEALARQKKTEQLLGVVLLEMGYIKGLELERALQRQVIETASSVLQWNDGRYRFSSHRDLDIDERLVEPISVPVLLSDGMGMGEGRESIEEEIPSAGSPPERSPGDEVEKEGLAEWVPGESSWGKGSPWEIQEGKPVVSPSRGGSPKIVPIGVSAMGLLLILFQVVILRSDVRALIPLSSSGENKVALAKAYQAKFEIEGWSEAVFHFCAQQGFLPRSLEELKAREKGMDLRERDPWGRTYRYQSEDRTFRIISWGADGLRGTADDIEGGEPS